MTTDQDPVVSGNDNPLVYTLTVRNQGSSALTGVVLRDDVPVGMYVTVDGVGWWYLQSCELVLVADSEYLTWIAG